MPTLGTGTATPVGPIINAEALYLEGGPNIWMQDWGATYNNNPDSDGFYYGMSGTAAANLFEVGCYDDLQLRDARTETVVKCAAAGIVANMQRRDNFELAFTLKAMLPLSILTKILGGGTVVHNLAEETEKMPLGVLPQNIFWHVFLSRVYDEDTGDFVAFQFHKVQVVEATPLAMPYGDAWNLQVRMMIMADTAKPAAHRFGELLRYDPSVL